VNQNNAAILVAKSDKIRNKFYHIFIFIRRSGKSFLMSDNCISKYRHITRNYKYILATDVTTSYFSIKKYMKFTEKSNKTVLERIPY
jgi:hypothetical protein